MGNKKQLKENRRLLAERNRSGISPLLDETSSKVWDSSESESSVSFEAKRCTTSVSSDSSSFDRPIISSTVSWSSRYYNRSNFKNSSTNFNYRRRIHSSKYDRFRLHAKHDDDYGTDINVYDANGEYSVSGKCLLSKPVRDQDFIRKKFACRSYFQSLKFLKKYEYFKYREMQRDIYPLRSAYERKKYCCKWKRVLVPKEQLDDDLDRYMAERKKQKLFTQV